ncbi:MAG: PLP-dependent transferase [Bacteroidetes bacterium]|nr:PLP-dependent transferase [Bacteroidota bacterium]
MKFSTKAIHLGQLPDETTGAIIPPVYLTSTYVQESPGNTKGYDYTRAGNPNFTNLETTLASLEHAKHATIFSSGLGAITGIISTVKAGDKVMASNDLYGGTYRIFTRVFSQYNVLFETINMQDLEEVKAKLSEKPKFIIIESPTNPLLGIADIAAITAMAKENGVMTVVDNTFASSYFQNPLLLGADVVMHSTTKYIGGHSDTIGGVLMTNDDALKEKFDFARMAIGLNPSPFDAWLTTRSIKTLGIRMERHAANAMKVAEFLEAHPKVKKVYYPGLPSHKNHEVAKKQMRGYSGIVSVEFNFDLEKTKALISNLKIFSLAESLGGVESLVDHPATMTHASIPKAEREKIGLSDGLVRFSVGIEDIEDIIQDITTGLDKVK